MSSICPSKNSKSLRIQRSHRLRPCHLQLLFSIFLLFLIQFCLLLPCVSADDTLQFSDVTQSAGLNVNQKESKYGGACVADVDGDGFLDLILGNHVAEAFIYFNVARNGVFQFTKGAWGLRVDSHGINAVRLLPTNRQLHIFVSRGGSRATNPNRPLFYSISPNRQLIEIPSDQLLDASKGRGRSMLPIFLSNRFQSPQLLFINAKFPDFDPFHHRLLTVTSALPPYQFKRNTKLTQSLQIDTNHYAMATDFDNDRKMDIITFQKLRIYRNLDQDYQVEEITNTVLPRKVRNMIGIRAIAEFDYDNDGYFDLFIARSDTNDLKWIAKNRKDVTLHCVLLKNVKGRYYIDVTKRTNIPFIKAQGVTTGDFNNDGFEDILITQETKNDLMLINTGLKSFTVKSMTWGRLAQGGQPVAADFDRDGRLDVILSEGDWFLNEKFGTYRLIRNISPESNTSKNWLLVRVKSTPTRSVSSLYAKIIVCITKKQCMYRRVGSPSTAVSNSYIDVVHFGLAGNRIVKSVVVQWIDGSEAKRENVKANRLVGFGSF